MTNEDAIKWLENLKNDIGNPHYECLWPYAQAIDEICALLKEQEPIAPSVCGSNEPDGHGSWWYLCGKCKMPIAPKERFCRRCGQAVKWDADD